MGEEKICEGLPTSGCREAGKNLSYSSRLINTHVNGLSFSSCLSLSLRTETNRNSTSVEKENGGRRKLRGGEIKELYLKFYDGTLMT